MKKAIVLMLIFALIMGVCGCGPKYEGPTLKDPHDGRLNRMEWGHPFEYDDLLIMEKDVSDQFLIQIRFYFKNDQPVRIYATFRFVDQEYAEMLYRNYTRSRVLYSEIAISGLYINVRYIGGNFDPFAGKTRKEVISMESEYGFTEVK